MRSNTSSKASSLAAILGAAGLFTLFAYSTFIQEVDLEGTILGAIMSLVPLLMGWGLLGLMRVIERARLGTAGLALALFGTLTLTLGFGLVSFQAYDVAWGLILLGMLAIPFGFLLFGLENWRKRTVSPWPAFPFWAGLAGGPLVLLLEAAEDWLKEPWQEQSDYGFMLWFVALLAAFIWVGVVLLNRERGIARAEWGVVRRKGHEVGDIGREAVVSRRRLIALGALLVALLAGGFGVLRLMADEPPPPPEPIDPGQHIIFHNGTILTMDPDQPVAEALAVSGGKIEMVGDDETVLATRRTDSVLVELQGYTLMPGFVDAHNHLFNDAEQYFDMSLEEAQAVALENGITSLGDLYNDQRFLDEIQALDEAGRLRIRTTLYLSATDPCGNLLGDWYQDYRPERMPGDMLHISGIKVFTDGGACKRPALSYELRPGEGLGDLYFSQVELNEMVAEIQALGFQAAIHALGDRGVDQALDAIEAALDGKANTYRHRIEHNTVIRPEQLSRYGKIGVIPTIFGLYNACEPFGPPPPPEYRAWEWPYRSLLEANPGLPVAWHGDDPFFGRIRPLDDLYSLVTRNEPREDGEICLAPSWLLDQTLTVEQALPLMTRNAAYALFRDKEVGTLTSGKFADLVVLSANPLAVDLEEIPQMEVWLTMVGGRVEYCAADQAWLCPSKTE